MKKEEEELEEEWVECHKHDCPDNPPFEGDKQAQWLVHLHKKKDVETFKQ